MDNDEDEDRWKKYQNFDEDEEIYSDEASGEEEEEENNNEELGDNELEVEEDKAEEESESEDDEDLQVPLSSDEENLVESDNEYDRNHDKMLNQIRQTLKSKKSSGRKVEVRDEFLEESQWNLPLGEDDSGKGKGLSVETLLGSLSNSSQHSQLQEQLSSLTTSKETESLSVPEQDVHLERNKRKQAYKEDSQLLNEWDAVVKSANKTYQSKFPLPSHVQAPKALTIDSLVVNFTPQTEMERGIEELLLSANLHQKKDEMDDLPPSASNPNFLRQQRAEMIRNRNSLAYQQMKVSRQNKIKSKRYRKIRKKERDHRAQETIDNDPLAEEEEQERSDRVRILERMTLRHKNKTKKARSAVRASHRF